MKCSGVAGGLQRIIDSATRNISDRLDWICLFTVNGMRRAQFFCHFQTRRHDVYRDDGRCSNSTCCHDRCASNCARAEGSEACTGSHIQRIHYRPGSGLNTAAERTEAFERYVAADLDHVAFIGECVCRKRRLAEKVIVNFLAIAVECSSAAVEPRSAEAEREGLFAMGN